MRWQKYVKIFCQVKCFKVAYYLKLTLHERKMYKIDNSYKTSIQKNLLLLVMISKQQVDALPKYLYKVHA